MDFGYRLREVLGSFFTRGLETLYEPPLTSLQDVRGCLLAS